MALRDAAAGVAAVVALASRVAVAAAAVDVAVPVAAVHDAVAVALPVSVADAATLRDHSDTIFLFCTIILLQLVMNLCHNYREL